MHKALAQVGALLSAMNLAIGTAIQLLVGMPKEALQVRLLEMALQVEYARGLPPTQPASDSAHTRRQLAFVKVAAL